MIILVINCGSSSIKYQVFKIEGENYSLLAKGIAERIGEDGSFIKHTKTGEETLKIEKHLADHKETMQAIQPLLTDPVHGVIKSMNDINGIGHRVVQGGEKFTASTIINDEVLDTIKEMSKFAPLHNPHNITGILSCQQVLPDIPNVAVFDTAIHQTMPPKAYMYAIPLKYYKEGGIRRYGFHGTSHGYVSKEAARVLGKPLDECKIITCHIGNGGSITAFDHGKVVDTSMGLTPLEGIVMGTRCGDIDPAAVLYLQDHYGLTAKQTDDILNKESGLKGLVGTPDMRDVLKMAKAGNQDAVNALAIYRYRIRKYIGAYLAALNGADAVVFTAGVGENNDTLRFDILSNMEYCGIKIDSDRNIAGETVISSDDSKIKIMVIPTNEELVIARDTYRILSEV
ncbi:Acetate kinase [Limihaloglobus sulfuriphilus]|uniref:Acetate kinase n=1 Tax=Limihaloglobus sulfuriphilus TaxID=1851148 RepID=A0A1Q2MC61_9BACT|nr:acetate kinase [Limihaloglobus sulfuriphilus]AQQ70296.1 Acetate kinase [Limihaloglobus sulfuriphilus]